MALNTQKAIDTPYVDDAQVDQDVEALHRASRKKDAVRCSSDSVCVKISSVIFS
jgi:hypothetical protein